MKKKLVSALLCATMVVGCLGMTACGGGSDSGDSGASSDDGGAASDDGGAADDGGDAADDGGDAADTAAGGDTAASDTAAAPTFNDTFGDANGTHLDLWTFVDVHAGFYGKMVEKWNEANPDRTIEVTAVSYPYADMHNKLLMSFQAGEGAPDICDVEVGAFPNVVAGVDQWLYPMDDALNNSGYKDDIVASRLETYMGSDGHYYGIPFHVGATIMYYNLGELQNYGITQADIDAIVTWDDWAALGKKYVEARGEEGKYWTSVDTGGTDWMWIAMAEYGEDWTGGFDGEPNVQLESVKNMLTFQKQMLDDGIAQISPDGQVDTDAGVQNIADHNIVAFPKAFWYTSRFLDKQPDEAGKWYLAPCPVFEEGQPRSVGIGGTGTVVTQESENKELAADFLVYAKCSPEAEQMVWDELGFDVCNTSLWSDDAMIHDDSNKFNAYFLNYPYDVLNEIKDEIGKIAVVPISPTINDQMNLTTFNEIFEDGADIDEALQEAQDAIELEM